MIAEYYGENALSVRFYDAVTSIDRSVAGDVDFYESLLTSPDQQVLEIGCGTGRVTIALAARGHPIIGIDLSESMLKQARLKCRNLAPSQLKNVSFLQSDMLKLDLPVRFDLIILPYYTFNHLKTRPLRAQCLAVIARHLLPGARAVIHAAAPEGLGKQRETRKQVFQLRKSPQSEEPSPRLEVTWRPSEIDEQERRMTQIVEYELFAADGTPTASSAERLTLWWFSDAELAASAKKAGLELERTLSSFVPEPGHQRIYELRKPG